jgi:hypothetical protein
MTSYTLQPVESLTVGPPAEGRRRRSPPSYPKVLRARQVSALALKGRAANWLSFARYGAVPISQPAFAGFLGRGSYIPAPTFRRPYNDGAS